MAICAPDLHARECGLTWQNNLKRVACSAIDQRVSSLRQLSEAIWANPELNYEEHKAHSLLTSFLKREDFDVDEKYTLDTAFRARAGGDSGINVAFICEYDALPDIGHACGHNLIAEAGQNINFYFCLFL